MCTKNGATKFGSGTGFRSRFPYFLQRTEGTRTAVPSNAKEGSRWTQTRGSRGWGQNCREPMEPFTLLPPAPPPLPLPRHAQRQMRCDGGVRRHEDILMALWGDKRRRRGLRRYLSNQLPKVPAGWHHRECGSARRTRGAAARRRRSPMPPTTPLLKMHFHLARRQTKRARARAPE